MTGQQDPHVVLGVSLEADADEIRAAYLKKVKEYPPDRAPEDFERIRDAYETLRDPRQRIEKMFLTGESDMPFTSLLDGVSPIRNFVGPEPWLETMAGYAGSVESRSRMKRRRITTGGGISGTDDKHAKAGES